MLLDTSALELHEVVISLGISCGVVLAGFWLGFRFLKRYRLIADTPTARVQSAHQGYVELQGQALPSPNGVLHSPLTGRECVWYHYKVEREKGSGKNRRWVCEREGTSDEWFQLDDRSGVCQIDPEGAEVKASVRKRWHGHTPSPTGEPPAHRPGFRFNVSFGARRYRYQEELILEYESVYALGRFQSLGGGLDQLDHSKETGEIIRQWKGNYPQLLARFDSNRNGQLDPDEWQQVQSQARDEILQRQKELQTMPTVHVLMRPDESDQPYLLSTYDEEKLARRYRWFAYGSFAALLIASWVAGEMLQAL
ncbi:E3 ubiquitin ligase family protein [Marinobacterium rhizophilum]|uniref:RING-type E3 ubiquitin transferase n=1 Tax=Marinobacterium rhizophilum TaxID=420402 RepID=A0ABY5HJD2_9GAMM|nr:E3 ubiquitin ligase family protein [Marinobacterium rhizophilum]UTW11917.1 hypothetical protein KDW95_22190 [Marinobacterium rhizophilum]